MEKEFNRREFIKKAAKISGYTLAGGSLLELASLKTGVGIKDAIDAARVGAEYGPGVALAGVKEPGQMKNVVELWREPYPTYRSRSPFRNVMDYNRLNQNVLLALGDSNMVGAYGKDRSNSPVELFKNTVEEKEHIDNWQVINLAESGFTTQMVIDRQLASPRVKEAFQNAQFVDVWINAGGNDMSKVAHTYDEVMEVQKLSRDPWKQPEKLLKYGSRLMENLDSFGKDFAMLLEKVGALNNLYSGKLRHITILSVPDFSKASSITTQEINNQSYKIPLADGYIQDLVENVSVRMNNIMFQRAEVLQKNTPIRVVGLDTFPISAFGSDQHFTPEADLAIAHSAYNRSQFQ